MHKYAETRNFAGVAAVSPKTDQGEELGREQHAEGQNGSSLNGGEVESQGSRNWDASTCPHGHWKRRGYDGDEKIGDTDMNGGECCRADESSDTFRDLSLHEGGQPSQEQPESDVKWDSSDYNGSSIPIQDLVDFSSLGESPDVMLAVSSLFNLKSNIHNEPEHLIIPTPSTSYIVAGSSLGSTYSESSYTSGTTSDSSTKSAARKAPRQKLSLASARSRPTARPLPELPSTWSIEDSFEWKDGYWHCTSPVCKAKNAIPGRVRPYGLYRSPDPSSTRAILNRAKEHAAKHITVSRSDSLPVPPSPLSYVQTTSQMNFDTHVLPHESGSNSDDGWASGESEFDDELKPASVDLESRPTVAKNGIGKHKAAWRNDSDVFGVYVHPQRQESARINDRCFRELFFDKNEGYSPSDRPLPKFAVPGTVYKLHTSASSSSPPQEWFLRWEQPTPFIYPQISTDPDFDGATFTFFRFPPGSIYVAPDTSLGSIPWWRLQICEVEHEKQSTPNGFYSGQFDEKIRPSRIVEHFASCKYRQREGDDFVLGKLARALQSSWPETTRRRKPG